uniref:PIN domain-containing protein n=2 Tax=environmental samples TaxID=651140 RepID=A0A075FUK2_9ARCH|nr:hypothetical protein [uncultured marine thaumarchaeote AD1000_05_B01]AIE95355.1 hypothetical protein [uncultured marine thaumarchaeote AD1000_65_A02]
MKLTQQKERTEEDSSTESITTNRNKEVLILLDSNIYIRNKPDHMLTVLAGKMGRYNSKLILPRIVLYEVSKVTRTSQQKVLKDVFRVYNKTFLLADNNEIKAEAKRLETYFYECHYPDSIILAIAKVMDAVLVTSDFKLRRTAEIEGVQAYNVKGFLKNWSVMA